MFSNTTKKEDVIGFYILRDGSFVKVHRNQQIEILKGTTRQLIKLNKLPIYIYDNDNYNVQIAELPNQRLVIACNHWGVASLSIVDLNSGACLVSKDMDDWIYSISACPTVSESAFRLSLRNIAGIEYSIFSYEQNDLIKKESFVSSGLNHIYILPDKADMIYFSSKPATVTRLGSNGVEEKSLQLCHDRGPHLLGFIAEKTSSVNCDSCVFPVTGGYFACIARCSRRGIELSLPTYHLHVIDNALTYSCKNTLDDSVYHSFQPDRLMFLSNEYVAILGWQEHQCILHGPSIINYIVQVFDLKCKKVNEIILCKNVAADYQFDKFSVATHEGQLVLCSKSGEITIHNIFRPSEKLRNETVAVLTGSGKQPMLLPKDVALMVADYAGFAAESPAKPKDKIAVEKLRNETESVLTGGSMFLPKKLADVVTDYAGFSHDNPQRLPDDTFTEITHPEWDSSLYARFKARMF